jgi:SNF2 family DNA or RNA helicase
MLLTASKTAPAFSRDRLHDYQNRAVSFIKDNPSCALWVDMGLGKTVTVLTAIADLLDNFEAHRVLIIAPLRVALNTWPPEIRAWDHLRHLTFKNIAGGPRSRAGIIGGSGHHDIHIINRELVPWLVEFCHKNKLGWPYDMVVIDEASSFKSSKTKRFKALRKALPATKRLVELTGTPASNGLLDVWPQVFLLDRGERLGKTFTGFRNRYFVSDFHGYNWTLRKGADQKIYDRLDDICLTLTAADYLDLPDRIDNTVPVDLPADARKQYVDLEREFLIEVGDDTVAVLHAAALANKLLQFANGAIYTDDQGAWSEVHDAKLDACAEIVAEAAGSPLLVAYNYKTDAERLLKRFPQAQVLGKDPAQIDAWNRGEIPILLAHPASAGHGLNLQKGGHTIVWFGLNWSLELYQQFNARLHRQGQDKPVIVHHLAVRDTVDETVLAALGRKDVTQRALLNALKEDVGTRVS